ncbi:MAG: DNA-3-methyladenine glycosylase I [Pseudomonadota bacterium]|jgi:DNA-3-methyladenine glycosylase I
MTAVHRCAWALRSPEETLYHDTEWGVPLHDDVKLFEYLVLDGAQAGLSWTTILKKREAYRLAFDGFDPERVARYGEAKIAALLADPGIVRNRLKIESAVRNAKTYLRIQEEFGSFDAYLWRFVDGTPVRNAWRELREVPASTPLSDALSRDLKQRGCNFVGSTICYAYLQAAGLVNDHLVDCFRWGEVSGG